MNVSDAQWFAGWLLVVGGTAALVFRARLTEYMAEGGRRNGLYDADTAKWLVLFLGVFCVVLGGCIVLGVVPASWKTR